MSEITFETGEIPKSTRPVAPNPFDGRFPSDDKTLTVVMPGTPDDETDNGKAIRRLIKQARDAAQAVDRSVRIHREVTTNGDGIKTTLSFWTGERITRKKNTDAAVPGGAASEAPEAVAEAKPAAKRGKK